MLENDMYFISLESVKPFERLDQFHVLELLSFKVGSGNHQMRLSLLQKFSEIFGNMRLVSPKMASHLTCHNFQILKIEIFSMPCKI